MPTPDATTRSGVPVFRPFDYNAYSYFQPGKPVLVGDVFNQMVPGLYEAGDHKKIKADEKRYGKSPDGRDVLYVWRSA